jgi:hypothetical protein
VIDPVYVYQWAYWDPASQTRKSSTLYGTLEVIRAGLGQPIHASAMKVERADLRDGGIYQPRPKETEGA